MKVSKNQAVPQMPFGGTGLGHGLNTAILGGLRCGQIEGALADGLVSFKPRRIRFPER